MIAYKIVREVGDSYKTLYHGINSNRELPLNTWIKAEKKLVKDGSGGKEYISGIHCFEFHDLARQYMKRFKNKEGLTIILCLVRGTHPKASNSDVLLADEILIPA